MEAKILQNFNHTSIIIHSLGKKLFWLPDCPGEANQDSLRAMSKSLNTFAHELDPERSPARGVA